MSRKIVIWFSFSFFCLLLDKKINKLREENSLSHIAITKTSQNLNPTLPEP